MWRIVGARHPRPHRHDASGYYPSSLPSSSSGGGGGARFVELGPAQQRPQEGSGHEECPLPGIFFYFVFKMVYFGAFWADLLTMRGTCDTITNTAAVAF